MDDALSTSEQQTLVASFLEIAIGQSTDTARQFLQVGSNKENDSGEHTDQGDVYGRPI
nr:plant UBX domain-containing protein 7 isoform X1 [Ipomoea batatas]